MSTKPSKRTDRPPRGATVRKVSSELAESFTSNWNLNRTRHERLKSAPYLRLKKLKLFEIVKEATLWVL